MPNVNFKNFQQIGSLVTDIVKQATGRDPVQNLDMDYVSVEQSHRYEDVDISGGTASFTAEAEGLPLEKCVVQIVPIQSGTGDPSPDNVRPISGWTGCKINRTGVNVWDEEWELGTYSQLNGTKLPASDRIRNKYPILVRPNTTYYLGSSVNATWIVLEYDATQNYISRSLVTNSTFTTNVNCHFINFTSATNFYGNTYNHDISMNYPSTDMDYHTYTGSTYSVAFPSEAGTVYGGTLTVNEDGTGTLRVDMAIVDLGTLTWMFWYTNRFYATLGNIVAGGEVFCEAYKTSKNSVGDPPYIFTNTEARALYIYDTSYEQNATGASQLKADLSGIHAVYEILEPITYELSNIEVIETLKGVNNIWADTGDIEVKFKDLKELY